MEDTRTVLAVIGRGGNKVHAAGVFESGRPYTYCGSENTNNLRFHSVVIKIAELSDESKSRYAKRLCAKCFRHEAFGGFPQENAS